MILKIIREDSKKKGNEFYLIMINYSDLFNYTETETVPSRLI